MYGTILTRLKNINPLLASNWISIYIPVSTLKGKHQTYDLGLKAEVSLYEKNVFIWMGSVLINAVL